MRSIAKNPTKKKQPIVKKSQKGSVGTAFIYVILGLLIVGGYVFVGGIPSRSSQVNNNSVLIVTPTVNPSHNNLQLETFGYVTITPTLAPVATKTPSGPKTSCGPRDDNGVQVSADCQCLDASVTCKNGQPFDDNGKPLTGRIGEPPVAVSTLCGSRLAPGDGRYCVAKPVIYLYPQQPTLVDVSVASTGNVVVSDPQYPQGGWKNVLANPGSDLLYSGKHYTELFYETDVKTFGKPQKGIIIPKNDINNKLSSILDQLGLIGGEKQEFLSYWLPRLQQLNTPYIYFSVIDKSVKDTIDNVTITPKPDTQIAFIAYFKPISDPNLYDNSLTIPPAPVRKGFVSVEWGGVIDLNN